MNIITSKTSKITLPRCIMVVIDLQIIKKYRNRFNNSISLNSRNKWFGWQLNMGNLIEKV